jgi:ABC-2 type transport system permease protein
MNATTLPDRIDRPFAVQVPARSFRNELRAIKIVWHRDMLRFLRDRPRIITALVQPLLYLFVLGTGLGSAMSARGGLDLRTFMFPGVMAMAVLFTCFFSAGSIVWDREFGFMREMLVAPVRRSAIIVGKCLGGATVGTMQGLVILAMAGLVGVPYSLGLIAGVIAELLLLSFAITAFALMIAARIRSMQAFMAFAQMLLMPLFFLSGALFPLVGLPTWLTVLTRLDPLTYAVDPVRRLVLSHAQPGLPFAGLTWGHWLVPTWIELALVGGASLLALMVAALQFRKAD